MASIPGIFSKIQPDESNIKRLVASCGSAGVYLATPLCGEIQGNQAYYCSQAAPSLQERPIDRICVVQCGVCCTALVWEHWGHLASLGPGQATQKGPKVWAGF